MAGLIPLDFQEKVTGACLFKIPRRFHHHNEDVIDAPQHQNNALPLTTMGSCTSQPQHPPLHERLDEYDDKVLARSGPCNSTGGGPIWWRKFTVEKNKSMDDGFVDWGKNDHIIGMADSQTTRTSPRSNSTMATISSDGGPNNTSPISKRHEKLSLPIHRNLDAHSVVKSWNSQPANEGNGEGWRVKRHGQALHLRLAKHRFLQTTITRQSSHDNEGDEHRISPLSLDSSFFPQRGHPRKQKSLHQAPRLTSSPAEMAGKSFDDANGMIWREITVDNVVTATAIARLSSESSFFNPVLLAMGDEEGVIVVTQLRDNDPSYPANSPDEFLQLSQGKTEENALKFNIECRVRSLHFGAQETLVAAGDGCRAWILQVVFAGEKLERLSILRQFDRIDRIYDAKFSRDYQYLAVGGFDGKCAIFPMPSVWDDSKSLNDDDSLHELLNESSIDLSRPGLIHCLDWSTDYLAVASNKHCAFYDARTFELVHEASRRLTTIQALQFSRGGSYLAMGEREVVILEAKPPFRVHCEISNTPNDTKLGQFRYRIAALCWSPSDSFLAIAGSDGVCLVVETKGFALVHQIERKEGINALSWIEQVLVVSDESKSVALVKAGIDVGEPSQMDDYSSAASSSNLSASTSNDWVLQDDAFRDIEDSASTGLPQDVKSQSNITAVAFSKKGFSSYLAYAADDCSLSIMTTRDWKVVFQIEFAKPIRSLAFSHSSNFLAMGGDESILYVLSVPTRSMVLNTIISSPIHSVAFSKRDERLSIGAEDGILSMLVVDAEFEPSGEIDSSDSAVLCQAWSTKTLAVGRRDGTVTLFDTEKTFCNFFVPLAEVSSSSSIRSLSFGVSENFLAIGGVNVVSILSKKGGWVLCNQIKTRGSVFSLSWSPAGRFLAFGGSHQCFQVCDTITWAAMSEAKQAILSLFEAQKNTVSCLDWSTDCKWMAIGSFGSGIHVLNTSDWRLLGPTTDGLSFGSSKHNKQT